MRNKSPEEMLSKLNQRQNRALQRRNLLLDERSERLKQRREDSTYQLLIHEKRQLLRNVKLRARLEYGLSSASIKRQTLLRRKAERFSVRVMHAQTVCMMQKLKKYVDLRRTFSQELDELLRQSMDADADRDDFDFDTKLYLTKSKSRFKSKSRRPKPPRAKSPAVGNTGVLVKDSPASSPEKLSPGKVSPSKISPSTASFLKSLSSSSGSPSSPESDLSSDDESLTDRIRRVRLLPPELYQSMEESEYMLLLDLLPPITRFTLRELDLDEILTNRQLRHDIIFDPDLQFKPNMDGERGEQKRAKADRYWSEVDIELGEGSTYRIPLLLHEVLAILLELLPPSQDLKRDIEDHLDVNLLAQELDHGVFNAAGLIKYLAELLKKNCAPARDELVDSMEAEALAGQTIKALRICFDVLEYMKLDYANHQLHRLRPHIVEHAVEYEWKQFRERFDLGSVKVDETVSWIHGAVLRFRNKTTKSIFADKIDLGDDNTKLPPFNVLYNEAFLSLVLQAHVIDTILPETLSMDQSRIVQYYNDWQDITILGSLVILFRQVCGPKCSPGAIKEVKQKLWVLLNDNETSIAHVCLQMSDDAAKIRGTALSEKEKTTLSGIVESTLSPSSALYDMMQKRIGGYFEYYLANGDLDRDLIRRHGLGELVPEIETLSTKMSKLIVHNKAVYSTVYSTIMEAGI
ncbi:T-complex protein 11-domain-containing protein [Polychytrium aggregatum]|uniref:T-complex protein 11-domain-containing protein n=1 Tax=Polychytrium aggregatum TaxID=110093 RepID=UPI0022FEFCA4|nr:T-complex protein 11-domain-containing protein [Polychytrium aggregatum]KAI9202747.1 T-complex protein 11-domain-containing protein [Polychytrium aggregatum]